MFGFKSRHKLHLRIAELETERAVMIATYNALHGSASQLLRDFTSYKTQSDAAIASLRSALKLDASSAYGEMTRQNSDTPLPKSHPFYNVERHEHVDGGNVVSFKPVRK